jgi:hypothetical protein
MCRIFSVEITLVFGPTLPKYHHYIRFWNTNHMRLENHNPQETKDSLCGWNHESLCVYREISWLTCQLTRRPIWCHWLYITPIMTPSISVPLETQISSNSNSYYYCKCSLRYSRNRASVSYIIMVASILERSIRSPGGGSEFSSIACTNVIQKKADKHPRPWTGFEPVYRCQCSSDTQPCWILNYMIMVARNAA